MFRLVENKAIIEDILIGFLENGISRGQKFQPGYQQLSSVRALRCLSLYIYLSIIRRFKRFRPAQRRGKLKSRYKKSSGYAFLQKVRLLDFVSNRIYIFYKARLNLWNGVIDINKERTKKNIFLLSIYIFTSQILKY